MTLAEKTLEQLNKLWIPVSVEMPKNEDEVIFCTTKETVETGIFAEAHYKGDIDPLDGIISSNGEIVERRWLLHGRWTEDYYTNDQVVAWMPYPNSYV